MQVWSVDCFAAANPSPFFSLYSRIGAAQFCWGLLLPSERNFFTGMVFANLLWFRRFAFLPLEALQGGVLGVLPWVLLQVQCRVRVLAVLCAFLFRVCTICQAHLFDDLY
jgi:hypothetical protein